MTLAQLRAFSTVARLRHVTRAAEELGITQSAVSASIAALEAEYDTKLFDRVGRSVRLSKAGEAFLGEAQAVLDRARAAERLLKELGGLAVGELEIAASQTIANYWLPRRLAAFHEAYPGIKLHVTIGNTLQVETAVVEGAADIGVVEGTTHSDELLTDIVDRDDMALVVGSKRWPGDAADVDLKSLHWVVREPGSGTRAVFEDLLAAHGLRWQDISIVLELPSNEAIREAVESGVGATLISRHVVAPGIAAGLLRELPVSVAPRSYRLLWHRRRHPTAAQQAITRMILQMATDAGHGKAATGT